MFTLLFVPSIEDFNWWIKILKFQNLRYSHGFIYVSNVCLWYSTMSLLCLIARFPEFADLYVLRMRLYPKMSEPLETQTLLIKIFLSRYSWELRLLNFTWLIPILKFMLSWEWNFITQNVERASSVASRNRFDGTFLSIQKS